MTSAIAIFNAQVDALMEHAIATEIGLTTVRRNIETIVNNLSSDAIHSLIRAVKNGDNSQCCRIEKKKMGDTLSAPIMNTFI